MFKSKLTNEQMQELRAFLKANPDKGLLAVVDALSPKFTCLPEDIILASIQIEFEAPPPN